MATDQATIEYLLTQLNNDFSTRKMFGEYALYLGNKVVAFVCDDQLFVKPKAALLSLFEDRYSEAPPYPGAKNYLLVPEEFWNDRAWLLTILTETAAALPEPKPKKRKS